MQISSLCMFKRFGFIKEKDSVNSVICKHLNREIKAGKDIMKEYFLPCVYRQEQKAQSVI